MKVLFVCTGNIFRSMSAEYLLRNLLQKRKQNSIRVSSAGTGVVIEQPLTAAVQTMHTWNIDITHHHQRKLNKEILAKNDIIVSMSKEHQNFIKRNYLMDSPLFNEISLGKMTSIPDIWEAVSDWTINTQAKNKYIMETIYYIHDNMPKFLKNVRKFENGL